MDYYERDNFWIELKNNLMNFYSQEGKIYLKKYTNNTFMEERNIIDKCRELKSVFLSKDETISIIYINVDGELILSNFFNDTIENSIVLIKNALKNDNMQIASVNNSLNIFYTKETNDIKVVCFRVLTNKLVLSPSIIIDNIDSSCSIPYVVSASDNGLAICYVKKGYPYSIGYRIYDIKTSTWLKFKELDKSSFPINNFEFSSIGDIVGYSYTCTNSGRTNIVCWIGNDNIKNKLIQENVSSIDLIDGYIAENNKLYLIYLAGDVLKIKELDVEGKGTSIDDIKLNNISYAKKYNYVSDKSIAKNNILIINSEEFDIYTDSNFIKKRTLEKYKDTVEVLTEISGPSILAEAPEETINKEEINNGEFDIDYIKPFIIKLKEYENSFNKLTEKFQEADEEKQKLIENIDELNSELNSKNLEIKELQEKLIDNKLSFDEYEDKINKLTEENKRISQERELESLKLNREVLDLQKEINEYSGEKTDYLEQIENLKIKINYLKDLNEEEKNNSSAIIVKQQEELKKIDEELKIKSRSVKELLDEMKKLDTDSRKEILDLKNEIQSLNNQILKYSEDISKVNEEKESYLNEVEILKRNVNKLNEIIEDNKGEINTLKDVIDLLEQKNNNDSFIKKLFKNGE